jgi:ABC-type antimicrobial peptide transport system permease subunit
MISSDQTTWINTKVGVIGIAVTIISTMVTIIAAALGLGYHVRWDILFFPHTPIEQTPIWGTVLALSFGIGIIAGFFGHRSYGLWTAKKNRNLGTG